jgi:hypothetical protein
MFPATFKKADIVSILITKLKSTIRPVFMRSAIGFLDACQNGCRIESQMAGYGTHRLSESISEKSGSKPQEERF